MRLISLTTTCTAITCTAVALCLLIPAMANAQTVELSPTQQQLNEEAVQAMVDRDFDKAVRQLETAVAIGDANILLLNLGRAYAKSGRCDEAANAYARAATAPPVEAPTASEVAAVLEKYRGELGQQCKTLLILECTPGNIEVQIGDQPRGPCTSQPIEVPAGQLTVRGFLGDEMIEEELEVQAARENVVSLMLDTPPPSAAETGPSLTWIIGWSALGTGLAVLGTTLVLDLAVLGPKLDDMRDAGQSGEAARYNSLKSEADTLQTVNIALLATGSVLTIAGLVLVLIPDDTESEGAALIPWIAPDAAGASWRLHF